MEETAASKRTLVIVRHAHRDVIPSSPDNGLSERGRTQAERLAELLRERFGGTKAIVISSPKLRALQTAQPIADAAGVELEVDERLDEQRPGESPLAFEKRILEFAKAWKKKPPRLLVACSHADWIPIALRELIGQRGDLEKGGWAEILHEEGEGRLLRVVQDP